MITLKGAEVSAKIKEQVLAMNGKLGGYVPTAAIVRIGERPDDLSYERNVMKRIAAYGMETKSYVYPAEISEEEFFAEFQKINAQYQGADRVKALLGLSGIFADDLPQNADFVGAVTAAYQQLCERGARECVAAL